MFTTDLGGHSGCSIKLCETEDGNVFVRKTSGATDYNSRLLAQAEKQNSFHHPTIKTPAVLAQGMTADGLFYFDMEYVQGTTLAEYVKTIEIGKLRGIADALVGDIVVSDSTLKDESCVYQKKIASLIDTLQGNCPPVVSDALQLLQNHDWSMFHASPCHGDLTLENIIIKDNQLYLIDFLDSFHNCWLLDLGTILQDVQTLWSYRDETDINVNTLIRLIVLRDLLLDAVKAKGSHLVKEVYYALLLKLIRILPYTIDSKTKQFLQGKIASITKLIRKEELV